MGLTRVIQPVPHKLVYNHPGIDEFLIFHLCGPKTIHEFLSALSELRQRRFDLVIDLHLYLKAGLLT